MSIITLTSDFGLKDYFVGSLKGKIYSEYAEAKLVDISHDIEPFQIIHTAYLLRAAHKDFPANTVHLVCVDAEKSVQTNHVVVRWHDQYFVGADNGIFSILTHLDAPDEIYNINIHDRFAADADDLDILKTVAIHLAKGGKPSVIGKSINALKDIKAPEPIVLENGKVIKGTLIYIDQLGNLVFNINKKMFVDIGKGRAYEIKVEENVKIKTIYPTYSAYIHSDNFDVKFNEGRIVAIFNDAEYLEIGLFRSNPKLTGSAKSLLGLGYKSQIEIIFL
jgi:S-adenosylmethionine hydrolase